jgi:hypothetical protein
MIIDGIEVHPVQRNTKPIRFGSYCPAVVTLRAYEVYCKINSPQPALITDGCRGGFGVGELLALLYARSYPENEWYDRVIEALRGMKEL